MSEADERAKAFYEVGEALSYDVHYEVDEHSPRKHVHDATCWCEPDVFYRDKETDRTIYMHKYLH